MSARNILIVDDDAIFSNLLSDVFKQAGYAVEQASSADAALEILSGATKFDLVVTDQRMPGTSGTEFVKKLMGSHKGLPVVMVSGFLSNDDIRQLIRAGIGGVFIKPLNIFQLLKRAAQLIDRKDDRSRAPAPGDAGQEAAPDNSPLSFRGARSALAAKFFKQLESLRSLTTNLVLVGNEGTNFEILSHDLVNPRTDTVFFINPADLDDRVTLAARLAGLATQGQGRLTLVLDRIEDLSPARTETVFAISRCGAPFDKLGQPVRFFFCLRADLDELFNAGRIDENLYLFMGTMELKVPSLMELREDIPAIAQSILDRRPGAPSRLDDAAGAALRTFDWQGGTKHLESVLSEAASATSATLISAETVTLAYEGRLSGGAPVQHKESGLREHLLGARDEYISAVAELFGDASEVAVTLGVPPETAGALLAAAKTRIAS